MRFLTVLLLLAGCTLGTPLMQPVHQWERAFPVSAEVRGYVVMTEYLRPELGVRVYERSYRYERYDPVTGSWRPAEIGEGGYRFTEAGAETGRAVAPSPHGATPRDAGDVLAATLAAEGARSAEAGSMHPPLPATQ